MNPTSVGGEITASVDSRVADDLPDIAVLMLVVVDARPVRPLVFGAINAPCVVDLSVQIDYWITDAAVWPAKTNAVHGLNTRHLEKARARVDRTVQAIV